MILSIDYRTDIPAFYSKWISNRFEEGYVIFRNPVAPNKVHKVILDNNHIEGIIWCSKNYAPLLPYLDNITDKFPSVFQYTITGYPKYFEPIVPKVEESIKTIKELAKRYGKEKIIWRYDPILFTEDMKISYHVDNFVSLIEKIYPYCSRVIVNFISSFNRFRQQIDDLVNITNNQKIELLNILANCCKDYGLTLQTCGSGLETHNLEGIEVTGCIDKYTLTQLGINTDYIKSPLPTGCMCFPHTSIGQYNTCMHKCKYCYASYNFNECEKNYKFHDPNSPLLVGNIRPDDIIEEMKPKLLNTNQLSLF